MLPGGTITYATTPPAGIAQIAICHSPGTNAEMNGVVIAQPTTICWLRRGEFAVISTASPPRWPVRARCAEPRQVPAASAKAAVAMIQYRPDAEASCPRYTMYPRANAISAAKARRKRSKFHDDGFRYIVSVIGTAERPQDPFRVRRTDRSASASHRSPPPPSRKHSDSSRANDGITSSGVAPANDAPFH